MTAKRKRKPAARKPTTCNAAVIRACVAYAQSIAAHKAGFEADPDGNSEVAEKTGERFSTAAHNALDRATVCPANSAEAIDAKARILPLILENSGGGLEEADAGFFRSFAADVRAFMAPIINRHFVDDLSSKRSGPWRPQSPAERQY